MTTDQKPNGAQPSVTEASRVRLGTGLSFWHGTVDEEYLKQLKPWSKAAKVFREMADDAVIGGMLDAVKMPLLSSSFSVEPPDEATDEEKRAQELIESALFNMSDITWREHVEDVLEFLEFGFALSEKIAEKRPDGNISLRTLMPIGQETLDGWGPLDELGNVTGFWQQHTQSTRRAFAPMTKLIHFTWRSRKRNPLGQSLLRSLYRPWYFKKNLEAIEAIGAERDVGNTPVATLGEGYYSDAQLDDMEEALAGLRLDETAYMIVPFGTDVKPLGSGGKVYNVRQMIRDWQHIMRQRFFADFLSLGSEVVGTQALANEMTTFFSLALRSVQTRMLEIWQKQLVEWLLRLNGFDLDSKNALRPPHLEWGRPGSENIQSLAQALNTLVGADLLTPDEDIEKTVRSKLNLPTASDQTARLRQEKADRQAMKPPPGQQPPSGNQAGKADDGLGDRRGPKPQEGN